jgi:hypothetical protein
MWVTNFHNHIKQRLEVKMDVTVKRKRQHPQILLSLNKRGNKLKHQYNSKFRVGYGIKLHIRRNNQTGGKCNFNYRRS